MRKEKALIDLLRGLVEAVAEEAAQNPDFATRIESILAPLPEGKQRSRKADLVPKPESLPDIHEEWNVRGEADFRLWLRDQAVPVLRALIRIQDLDATRRTVKWKEAAKLAEFIADGLRSRLSRGSAFIGRDLHLRSSSQFPLVSETKLEEGNNMKTAYRGIFSHKLSDGTITDVQVIDTAGNSLPLPIKDYRERQVQPTAETLPDQNTYRPTE